MKKLFIIAVLFFTANLSAQDFKLNTEAKDPVLTTCDTGDRIKIKIKLSGKIEIDGHIFDNKKSKDPVFYEADISEIKIYNSKGNYKKRHCNESKCDILHLEAKSYGIPFLGQGIIYQNNTLELIK